nr:hypothetical protein [Desulfobacula sp.]
ELHFQEVVAIPIKDFLEDKENKLPDGKFLKEHILYIVICHGLPFSSEGVFGIERGVTSAPNDHGDLGSLEQRLQTLYLCIDEGHGITSSFLEKLGISSSVEYRNEGSIYVTLLHIISNYSAVCDELVTLRDKIVLYDRKLLTKRFAEVLIKLER